MNSISDVEGAYPVSPEAAVLAELIDDLLGGADCGSRVIAALLAPGEQATARNIRDRLRVALNAGRIAGLTPTRLHRLQSALELGKRLYLDEPLPGETIDSPHLAAQCFQAIAWEPVENFAVLSLDVKHRFLACRVVSSGSATETLVYPRALFGSVIQAGGVRCIVAHNHPSGDTTPSPDDLTLTRQLLDASQLMNLPILDHLVVSQGAFTSIRETTALWSD